MPASRQSSRDKVRAHRERMRAKGLRPVTVWTLDLRSAEAREALRRQCEAIAAAEHKGGEEVEAWNHLQGLWEEVMASEPPYDPSDAGPPA